MLASEAILWRLRLNVLGLWVVLDLSFDALCADGVIASLRSTEAIVRGRLQGLVLELVIAGTWDQLVPLLLELVMVKG